MYPKLKEMEETFKKQSGRTFIECANDEGALL